MFEFFRQTHRSIYRKFLRIIGFSQDRTSRNLFRLFQLAVYSIIFVFLLNMLSPVFGFEKGDVGAWGDFFGGVLNPILTFLTFMGLLITIIVQQSELKESRKEFKRTADALSEQSENLRQQKFENTFFNMISFLNECGKNLNVIDKENNITGRAVFVYYHKKLLEKIVEAESLHRDNEVNKRVERGVLSFSQYYDHEVGHYFNQIKNLLRFIDSNGQENKNFFSNMLSSQLTIHEKGIIFHYAFVDDEYMSLVDRHQLLLGLNLKHFTYNCQDPYDHRPAY